MFYNKDKNSNLIDIELVYIKNKNISRRLLVEGSQNVETLCNTIKDILEIFPKLSDLTNLSVSNLKKKYNKDWIELNMNTPIENQIKQKDKIYFDLKFEDIWVDVIMTLKDEEDEKKTNKFSFELKTDVKKNSNELEKNLIYSGIGIWEPLKDSDDYYLFKGIEINLEEDCIKKEDINMTQQLENSKNNNSRQASNYDLYSNQSNDYFSFNDKISCTLKFINFTNYICNYITKEIKNIYQKSSYDDEESNNSQEEKVEFIKNFFNNNFRNLYLNKSKNIIEYVNERGRKNEILLKVSSEYFKEKEEVRFIESSNLISNSPANSFLRYIGPNISTKSLGKRDIEMQTIIQERGKYSFQDKINRNSFNSFNSSNSFKISENEQIDFNEEFIDEINFIRNDIDFDGIFDKINSYILNSKFKVYNDERKRNLKILEGEILKNAKLDSKEEAIKYSNAIKIDVFKDEEENYYENQLLKKYIIIFIVIVLVVVFIKIIF